MTLVVKKLLTLVKYIRQQAHLHYRLIANGYDRDGSLEHVSYYVDGKRVPIATAYLQLLNPPVDGETFSLDDGLGNFKTFRI